MTLTKVVSVKPVGDYRLQVTFSDGSHGERDLSALVALDRPLLAELRDPRVFDRVFLQRGAPTWPNGFDIAPWALHDDMLKDGALHPAARAAQ